MNENEPEQPRLSRTERRRRRVIAGALATAVLALSSGVPATADPLGAEGPQQNPPSQEYGPGSANNDAR
ncbi:MAG TPA: hypothetical protein VFR49_04325 [Solirubrobacteraceae bacterium]|nr:hypothetical protein [Solirubrobacteraceae bacterium]